MNDKKRRKYVEIDNKSLRIGDIAMHGDRRVQVAFSKYRREQRFEWLVIVHTIEGRIEMSEVKLADLSGGKRRVEMYHDELAASVMPGDHVVIEDHSIERSALDQQVCCLVTDVGDRIVKVMRVDNQDRECITRGMIESVKQSLLGDSHWEDRHGSLYA